MIHITNGDCAAGVIRETDIAGPVIPWRDVLHEGPVPDGLSLDELRAVRARFIAVAGWGAFDAVLADLEARDGALAESRNHDEVVLWFEHDLYDQLQLLQLLDWFAGPDAGRARVSLVCGAEYLGSSSPARLRERFPSRHPVSDAQLVLAREAWAAFRSPDPTALTDLVTADTSALPFLRRAIVRHLQQFPSVTAGLSRSEAQALAAIRRGAVRPSEIYAASHRDQEEAIFLGDVVFAWYVEGLSRVPEPLVAWSDGERIAAPRSPDDARAFWDREVRLTEAGRRVLDGEADRVQLNGIDRWLGGAHLRSPSCWRWDDAAQRLRGG